MSAVFSSVKLNVYYGSRKVLNDVSIELAAGEIWGFAGESGSGKSTFIKACTGTLPKDGMVEAEELSYKDIDLGKVSQRRRLMGPEIAMIFQDPAQSLSPVRKIGAQIKEMFKEHGRYHKEQTMVEVQAVFRELGFEAPDRILNSYPYELSGGMNQRVGIAMALCLNPSVIFADEPTASLDVVLQKEFAQQLLAIREKQNTAFLIASHDLGFLSYVSDYIAVMYQGNIVEKGRKEEILNNPVHPYTKKLLASVIGLNKKMTVAEEIVDKEKEPKESPCCYYKQCPQSNAVCFEKIGFQDYGNAHKALCNMKVGA